MRLPFDTGLIGPALGLLLGLAAQGLTVEVWPAPGPDPLSPLSEERAAPGD
ncbi:hypothetical protein ACOXXX_18650 [Thalassococcus sp. BH17M4-6]|uniref:hypothetical protein n=1 Tax=Thalassococcus sp. BH17M4-6 TaxID=3413148 RepID=UPI003BD868F0